MSLTNRPLDVVSESDRPARETDAEGHEIEITPEMIAAGIEEYALFDFQDRGEWVVSAIYRAMAKKAPPR